MQNALVATKQGLEADKSEAASNPTLVQETVATVDESTTEQVVEQVAQIADAQDAHLEGVRAKKKCKLAPFFKIGWVKSEPDVLPSGDVVTIYEAHYKWKGTHKWIKMTQAPTSKRSELMKELGPSCICHNKKPFLFGTTIDFFSFTYLGGLPQTTWQANALFYQSVDDAKAALIESLKSQSACANFRYKLPFNLSQEMSRDEMYETASLLGQFAKEVLVPVKNVVPVEKPAFVYEIERVLVVAVGSIDQLV